MRSKMGVLGHYCEECVRDNYQKDGGCCKKYVSFFLYFLSMNKIQTLQGRKNMFEVEHFEPIALCQDANPHEDKVNNANLYESSLFFIFFTSKSNNFQLQNRSLMSRDNSAIRNKLLDAFIPSICFREEALPLQPKNSSKIIERPKSSMTRQSYINLDEHLQEDSLDFQQNRAHFFSTEASLVSKNNPRKAESSSIVTQRKSNRKYLKVVSNPHEAIPNNSPRQSMKGNHLRKSHIFESKQTPASWLSIQPASSQIKRGHSHHQSCKILQHVSNERSSQFPINFGSYNNASVQLQASKIQSLKKLIDHEQAAKPSLSFSKATYLRLNEPSTLPLRQAKQSINPRPSIIYPRPDSQSNILRVAIGKVQPVFRTIVRKDISNSVNVQRAQSQVELKITPQMAVPCKPTPKGPNQQNKFGLYEQKLSKFLGKQNQMLRIDTVNMRSQIARQVLR